MSALRKFVGGLLRDRSSIGFTRLECQQLEDRTVPSGAEFRSLDGTGNNIANPDWGSTETDFIRLALAQYADGVSTPAGDDRPSARVISNAVADQGDSDGLSVRGLSAMVYAWGQFIDHDFTLSKAGTGESFNVSVPTGDPSFDPSSTGTQVIPLIRTAFDSATGTDASNPRQQVNSNTAWLDGSMVYGSDAATAASLRTFQGGQLKTSAGDLLPTDSSGNYLAGDSRVNENPELTSLQTVFMREHNRVAAQLAAADPTLTDEELYQQAKAWVTAEIEAITYNEWLPAILGHSLAPYVNYDPSVDPSISNEFATAGFRFGHSLLGDDIEFLADDGTSVAPAVALSDAFNNPSIVQENGIEPILKYLSSDPSSEVDTLVVNSVRNLLFGQPGSGGLDLASLNIQRGRDHGLADYNSTRESLGLPRVTEFDQITSDTALQDQLRDLYGTVDNIDLWVGGLAEDHVPGGSLGVTFSAILTDQFTRMRDGDRFWYQKTFAGAELNELEVTTLSDVIRRNTSLSNLQSDVFFFQPQIAGKVVRDTNRSGAVESADSPVSAAAVELVNATSGETVATATTDASGAYRFGVLEGLRTGQYEARYEGQTSSTLAVTRGDSSFASVDFLQAVAVPVSPPAPVPRLGIVCGEQGGLGSTVRTYAPDGTAGATFEAFEGFAGGVELARGDVDGDGVVDIIAGAGPGALPHIKVFSGKDLSLLHSFLAFDATYAGGVTVAAGDVDGDGRADIVVGSSMGASAVKVFSGRDLHELFSFLAFDSGFTGGVTVSAGDLDGDGRADIGVATRTGSSHVMAYSGREGAVLLSRLAYDAGYTGGVSIAIGDFSGMGHGEIVVGTRLGTSHVEVLDREGATRSSFLAFDPGYTGGINLGAMDADGDGQVDLGVGTLAGGSIFLAFHIPGLEGFESLNAFGAYYRGGIAVA